MGQRKSSKKWKNPPLYAVNFPHGWCLSFPQPVSNLLVSISLSPESCANTFLSLSWSFSPPPSIPSVSLVNKAVVDYFFVELGVERHFEALRHFLLMEDGEFAQSLSDLLFEKVTPFQKCCRHRRIFRTGWHMVFFFSLLHSRRGQEQGGTRLPSNTTHFKL